MSALGRAPSHRLLIPHVHDLQSTASSLVSNMLNLSARVIQQCAALVCSQHMAGLPHLAFPRRRVQSPTRGVPRSLPSFTHSFSHIRIIYAIYYPCVQTASSPRAPPSRMTLSTPSSLRLVSARPLRRPAAYLQVQRRDNAQPLDIVHCYLR